MNRMILAASGAVLLIAIAGRARAETCPATAPTKILFELAGGTVEVDTSFTAKEIAAKNGAKNGERLMSGSEGGMSASMRQGMSITTMGTPPHNCVSLATVTFVLGLKHKAFVAKELTQNQCVADAYADQQKAAFKVQDDAAASFGANLPTMVGPDIAAIGTVDTPDADAGKKEITDKVRAVLSGKIMPAFEQTVSDAAKSVDLDKLPLAECQGITKKLVGKLTAN